MEDAGDPAPQAISATGGASASAPRPPAAEAERGGLRDRLVRSHMLFRANLLSGHVFVRARRSRRAVRPRIHWLRYFVVVALLTVLVAITLDQPVGAFRGHWPGDVSATARAVTDVGKSGWILIPTGVAILVAYSLNWEVWGARRRIFVLKWVAALGFIFFSIAAGGLIADIVKYVVGRARPVHFQELGAFSLHPFTNASFASFPSGHSTTMGGLFAALALLFPRFRLGFLILALWIVGTRVLVGAHYPSDVVAGLAWGAWFSYFSAMLFARHGLIFTYDARGWPVRRSGYRPFGRYLRLRRLLTRRRAKRRPAKN